MIEPTLVSLTLLTFRLNFAYQRTESATGGTLNAECAGLWHLAAFHYQSTSLISDRQLFEVILL
jgi:hypothetical protein